MTEDRTTATATRAAAAEREEPLDTRQDQATTRGEPVTTREDPATPREAPRSTAELADAQAARRDAPAPATEARSGGNEPLFGESAGQDMRERWTTIQTEFVDAPADAVKKADALVAEALQQLTETFANERRELERAWSGGGEASTEDLRQAIRRYRSFFNRLLAI